MKTIAIIGANGAIGGALLSHIAEQYPDADLYAFSRSGEAGDRSAVDARWIEMDFLDEDSIKQSLDPIPKGTKFDAVIVATGILHTDGFGPEKALSAISPEKMQTLFAVNTIGPSLVMKHFTPHMNRKERSVIAVISARVGSLSDNRLGGWYSYRASKAALNMVVKTASIEAARRYKKMVIVALHPGTVDSDLSEPFQGNVPDGMLFSPAYSAERLWQVIQSVEPDRSGQQIAWDGQTVPS